MQSVVMIFVEMGILTKRKAVDFLEDARYVQSKY